MVLQFLTSTHAIMIAAITSFFRRVFGAPAEQSTQVKDKKMSGGAKTVTDATFEQMVMQSELPVLVDFYANWCGPCKEMLPKVDELARIYEGRMLVVKSDTDVEKRFMRKYEVKKIPTLLYMYKGEILHRTSGNLKLEQLKADCDEVISKAAAAK